MKKILFVCLGNICRSPAAEEILRVFGEKDEGIELHIESSGIGDWHVGQKADARMVKAAKNRGFLLRGRARQFENKDFDHFDWIFVADKSVLEELLKKTKHPHHKSKLHLMTAFSKKYLNKEVPDPYLEEGNSFEVVLDILEDSCTGILHHIKKETLK